MGADGWGPLLLTLVGTIGIPPSSLLYLNKCHLHLHLRLHLHLDVMYCPLTFSSTIHFTFLPSQPVIFITEFISLLMTVSLSLSHRHTTRTFSFLSISNTASHFIDHAPDFIWLLPSQVFKLHSFYLCFFLYQQVIYRLVIGIYFFALSHAQHTHVIFWYQQHCLTTTRLHPRLCLSHAK